MCRAAVRKSRAQNPKRSQSNPGRDALAASQAARRSFIVQSRPTRLGKGLHSKRCIAPRPPLCWARGFTTGDRYVVREMYAEVILEPGPDVFVARTRAACRPSCRFGCGSRGVRPAGVRATGRMAYISSNSRHVCSARRTRNEVRTPPRPAASHEPGILIGE